MPDISAPVPAPYLTDGDVLAWLEQKSEEQNIELRNMMNTSTQRGELMKDLTQLKADTDAGAPPAKLDQAMQAIRDKYEGTPFEGEIDGLLGYMQGRLEGYAAAQVEYADVTAQLASPDTDPNDLPGLKQRQSQLYEAGGANTSPNPFADEFSTKLQAEVDQLGRVDGLDLINIQKLMGDERQREQLGSNFIANRDQTSNAIVGNIRG